MPCPHCGGTQLDGRSCAFCGAQLVIGDLERVEGEEVYEMPYRSFWIDGVKLQIAKDFVVIEKKALFQKTVYKISYEQLVEVVFVRTEHRLGQLKFRWYEDLGQNGSVLHAEDCQEVMIWIGSKAECAYFYHIFFLFKLLAPQVELTTQFAEADEACLREHSNISDLDGYFKRFQPHREQAVSALTREHALSEKEARFLVDALFNRHQKALYEAFPSQALKDYNSVKAEKQRVEEEEARERESRAKQWR